MAAFSLATGLRLLYDEGVLPPNPERQALAFASPADASKLGSDGLAFKRTATALAMEDESVDGTVILSPAAMDLLVQDLASPESTGSDSTAQAGPQAFGYPYGGWSSVPAQMETAASAAPNAATPAAPISLLA